MRNHMSRQLDNLTADLNKNVEIKANEIQSYLTDSRSQPFD